MRFFVALLLSLTSMLCGTIVQDGSSPGVVAPAIDGVQPLAVLTSVQVVEPQAEVAAPTAPVAVQYSDAVVVRSWGPLRARRLRGGSTGIATAAYGSTGSAATATTTTTTTTVTTEAVVANGSTGSGGLRGWVASRPARNLLGRTLESVRRTGNCR